MPTYKAPLDEIRFLLQVGEYRSGSDALADAAIERMPQIEALLRQRPEEACGFDDAVARLLEVVS